MRVRSPRMARRLRVYLGVIDVLLPWLGHIALARLLALAQLRDAAEAAPSRAK